uniref:AAA+ ATPase domain-containing protein n=1 Tax=viral metagenome TaxID=1070528 RepID=A0A6C0D929_9ZZZZ
MRKKKQDYKEFIRNMDLNENITHYNKTISLFSKNTEKTKEHVDDILSNINKKYNYDFFYNFSLKNLHSNSYNDPNILSFEISLMSSKNQTCCVSKKQPRPPITPDSIANAYSAALNYKSTVSEIMKETADNIQLHNSKNKHNKNKYIIPHHHHYPPNQHIKIIPKTKVFIENVEIKTLDDLISLIEKYPMNETIEYNINMVSLHKIKSSLIDLKNMIGMKDLKDNVVDQILYYIQDLNKSGDFMHTVIYGPPGTGKTEIAKIIGQIFSKLGILKKGTFRKVTRSDLIAGYLGQTAIKTNDVINDCLGGVLFIDEAYSLGNSEKKDSFSKECIDTLCEALSNHKDNFMVIIAGYENELKECFFNYNQGLDSRFTWRFKTDEYKGEELYKIFIKKVKEIGWEVSNSNSEYEKINIDWFIKNLEYFKFFGRDVETLLAKTKIAHARRVFCKPQNEKMKITLKDLENGFELYLKNDEVKNRKDADKFKNLLGSMYV